MCLTVRNVPTKKQIIICKKSLYQMGGGYQTPLYPKAIPENGWLFPDRMRSSNLTDGTQIHGGFIHSYTNKKREYAWVSYYKAYAFGVTAYNKDMTQLVCRALYIPEADTTESNTEDIILGFSQYNKAVILKRLPILKRIEKYL